MNYLEMAKALRLDEIRRDQLSHLAVACRHLRMSQNWDAQRILVKILDQPLPFLVKVLVGSLSEATSSCHSMPFSLENQVLSRLNLPEMGKKKSLTVGLAIDLILNYDRHLIGHNHLSQNERLQNKEMKIKPLLNSTERGLRVHWQRTDTEFAQLVGEKISSAKIVSCKKELAREWLMANHFRIPTTEQLDFIIDTHHSIRLTARAGCGKTETISTKILFLLHFIGLNCNHILVLVFNREARDDLIKRVESLESKAGLPSKGPYAIMNFDQLARGVVRPKAKILKGVELEKKVEKLVQDFLSGSNENSKLIKQLMLNSFRSDWEKWLQNKKKYTKEQLDKLRHILTEEAIDGTVIKSKGEKRLADFFFEHDIAYHYEFPWRTERGVVIYPDFYLPQLGLVVEFWGLAGDKDYDETSEFKRRYWSTKKGYSLVEIYPENLVGPSSDFLEGLEVDYSYIADLITRSCLEQGMNIVIRRLSDEEILDKLKRRIKTVFGRLVSSSIARLGQRCRTNADVVSLVNAFHVSDDAERQFVNLLPIIDQAYRDMLISTPPPSTDFSQLKWECIDQLSKGVASFSVDKDTRRVFPNQLSYIFVDEFQDFSELYLQIITSLLGHSNNAIVNAVGDDWQMINRFAGSDLSLFEGFSAIFPRPRDLTLTVNFRSDRKIVEFCNSLMDGQGTPAKPSDHLNHTQGRVSEVPISALQLNDAEGHHFKSDPMLSALLRLIPFSVTRLGLLEEVQKAKVSVDGIASLKPFVFVLSRTKRLKGLKAKPSDISFVQASKEGEDLLFVEEALSVVFKNDLSPSSIRVLTAHSSKGKEAEVVVLLAPEQFPLIHPSSAFLGIFGDTLEQLINDERRLFYVACSRARKWLLLLTFSPAQQPDFLPRDLLDPFDWKEAP